ncbi:MAG: lysophospholipid acyltransferase family protein [Paludibacter sp.]
MYKFIYALIYIITLLPLRVLYLFSDVMYPLMYYVVRYRRDVVRKNLTNSFPEKSIKEIIRIEKKFYRHFSDLFIEAMYRMNITAEEYRKRTVCNHLDIVKNIYADDKSAFLMLGHFGNWEWTPMGLDLPLESPLNPIYKQLKNQTFDLLTKNLRERFGTKCIEMRSLFKTLLLKHKAGEKGLFLMLGDQRPKKANTRLIMSFLNQPTSVFTGTEVMARKFNYPVLFLSIDKSARGHYSYSIEVISMNPKDEPEGAITEKYIKRLEEDIQKKPELWLWTHDRWKHKIETPTEE